MAVKNVSHPYLPKELQLPGYIPNTLNAFQLLGVFFAVLTSLISVTVYLAGQRAHTRPWSTRAKLAWFVSCAAIHTVLEGYFGVYHKSFSSGQNFLDQVWKEYSKCDSRYISGDAFTVCMEMITGLIDGPLCMIALYAFFTRQPYRYTVQLILSLCQLYGDVLYFTTEYKEGFVHGEMYHPQYFWFYFVFMNSIWIIVPTLCIIDACHNLHQAQTVGDAQRTDTHRAKAKKLR